MTMTNRCSATWPTPSDAPEGERRCILRGGHDGAHTRVVYGDHGDHTTATWDQPVPDDAQTARAILERFILDPGQYVDRPGDFVVLDGSIDLTTPAEVDYIRRLLARRGNV